MTTTNTDHAKKLAKLLREDLASAGYEIPYSLALELIAHQFSAKDWNILAAIVGRSSAPVISPGVPVLRVMSVAQVLPFYLDYLGFTLDWEHRFEPGLPLYVQVSRSAAVLHLSEHHGDGSPHGVVWFPVRDVSALRKELHARPNAPMRPGIDPDAPGGPTMEVIDPNGNILRFAQSEVDEPDPAAGVQVVAGSGIAVQQGLPGRAGQAVHEAVQLGPHRGWHRAAQRPSEPEEGADVISGGT